MTTVATRKRTTPTVDVSAFVDQVEIALAAFAADESYAVAMARAAVVIGRKRAVWQARRTLRAAEAHAKTECAELTFDCHAASPCGTGDCKFAEGELCAVEITAQPGTAVRPQRRSAGPYDREHAVTVLAQVPRPR